MENNLTNNFNDRKSPINSKIYLQGSVAQRIEQWFPKPCAACSNHAGATNHGILA